MLVTFRSEATESITMFGDSAKELLKLMGATGRIPGAFTGDDVSAALSRLEAGVDALNATTHTAATTPANNEDFSAEDEGNDEKHEPPVALATRAVPLLSLMKRAAAARAAVTWEGK